jgi:hypothetical protein
MKKLMIAVATLIGLIVATSTADARRYQGQPSADGSSYSQHRIHRSRTKATRKVTGTRHARRSYRSARSQRSVSARASIRRNASSQRYKSPRARVARTTHQSRTQQRRARSSDSGPRLASLTGGGFSGVGPRPRQWCGWWMRTQLGGGPQFNLAWNWRSYGSPASAQVGAVVVWRHHVGIITGQASNGKWVVKSGNDGGRVRERARSVSGAVFRI